MSQFNLAHATFCEEQLAEQQLRIEVASQNIRNMDTTRTPEGGPFKQLRVVCGLGPCVQVEEPDDNGYERVPAINEQQQMNDLKIAQTRYVSIRQQCE